MARLGDICYLITDGSHNPPAGVVSSDYKMLSSKNIDDDEITFDDPRYLSEEDFIIEDKRTNVSEGDLLMTIVGTVGRVAVVPKSMDRFCLQRSVAVLKPKRDIISSRFLMYQLQSMRTFIEQESRGVAQKGIYLKQVSNLSIMVPTIKKQQVIVDILDKLTSLISLRKQQLAKLDELVKARFVEMFGDMFLNPLAWPERQLESMADIVSGITKGRKTQSTELFEVPYMAVSNVKDGYIDWTTVKTIMAAQSEIDQYRILPNDVLMTEGGDPDKLGRGAIIRMPMENCIHQNHIFRVRLDRSIVLPEFFAEYLQHQKAKRYFLGCAKQTTGIASINMKQLRALPVLVPPISIQEVFADFTEQVRRQKLTIQKGLDKMEVLKKSLMQEYFG